MPKYDFHLRSGKTVTVDVDDLELIIDRINDNIARSGRDDLEWISCPGLMRAVRFSDIEGWAPTSVLRDGDRLVTVKVAPELLAEMGEWSEPVQVKIEQRSSGTYDMIVRRMRDWLEGTGSLLKNTKEG